jgi:hypothetical protein
VVGAASDDLQPGTPPRPAHLGDVLHIGQRHRARSGVRRHARRDVGRRVRDAGGCRVCRRVGGRDAGGREGGRGREEPVAGCRRGAARCRRRGRTGRGRRDMGDPRRRRRLRGRRGFLAGRAPDGAGRGNPRRLFRPYHRRGGSGRRSHQRAQHGLAGTSAASRARNDDVHRAWRGAPRPGSIRRAESRTFSGLTAGRAVSATKSGRPEF